MEQLYALQSIDVELERIKNEEFLAHVKDDLRQSENKLTTEEEKQDRLSKKVAIYKKRMRRAELDLETVDARIERLQKKIFGGEVTNAKELEGLQKRLDADKERKGTLEDEILTGMETLEQASAIEQKLKGRLARIHEEVEQKRRRLEEERAKWQKRQAELEQERERIIAVVSPGFLGKYRNLYARLDGRPVARVEERSCSACHVQLPVSARPPTEDQLARCPSCGRLLWWPVE